MPTTYEVSKCPQPPGAVITCHPVPSLQRPLLHESQDNLRPPDPQISDKGVIDEGILAKVEEIKPPAILGRDDGLHPSHHTTSKGQAITTSGDSGKQGILESSSSKKKKLRERKLLNQGSV